MQLATERLVLREFEPGDWFEVRTYQNDPRYLRYYKWTDRSPEAVQAFIQMFLDQQIEEPRIKFQLAMTLKENGRLIGNCGIRMTVRGTHNGNIGYELSPDQWGNGYATEAARAIVDFGFNELRLHRISAECIAENTGSIKVLQKLGFTQEGRLRQNDYFKDRWWDTLLFGILKHEWRSNSAPNP